METTDNLLQILVDNISKKNIITGSNGGSWTFIHQIDYGQMMICILLALILSVQFVKLISNALKSWW